MSSLKEIARTISENIVDWMGEATQEEQVEQSEDAYWEHLDNQIICFLEMAYEIGWHEAAAAAIAECNKRESIEEYLISVRNEAGKCGLQIEHALVTGRNEND